MATNAIGDAQEAVEQRRVMVQALKLVDQLKEAADRLGALAIKDAESSMSREDPGRTPD